MPKFLALWERDGKALVIPILFAIFARMRFGWRKRPLRQKSRRCALAIFGALSSLWLDSLGGKRRKMSQWNQNKEVHAHLAWQHP